MYALSTKQLVIMWELEDRLGIPVSFIESVLVGSRSPKTYYAAGLGRNIGRKKRWLQEEWLKKFHY